MSDFGRRIYLTGFMGSGKSTIGPILANVLGYDFVDLDEAVEERAGKPVPRIFAEDGEAAFRLLEATLLRETGARDRVVVALGGGALAVEDNLQWALANGAVVYLRVALDALVRRLRRGRIVRPLLLNEAGERLPMAELREKVKALMDRREPFYERAHVVVEIANQRVGLTVDEVVKAVRKYAKNNPQA